MNKQVKNRRRNNDINTAYGRLASKRGMTMAEMLITVAIIIILLGVVFISLIQLQRTLAQRERDSIARELFICAQNHLTMARGEGYLGLNVKDDAVIGTAYKVEPATGTAAKDIRYFVVNKGDKLSGGDNAASILDLMLPFGSIDETVRMGGNYVICYELKTGTVTDVFYCSASGSPKKFNHDFAAGEYTTQQSGCTGALKDLTGDDKSGQRRTYNESGAVLGWYGGDDDLTKAKATKTPSITVENADKLIVRINDPNNGTRDIKLLLTGKTSKVKMALAVDKNAAEYVLDDVTEVDKHFDQLKEKRGGQTLPATGKFIPGEDITVVAVAYSNSELCSIEYSDVAETNSLFESISDLKGSTDKTKKTAQVSSIRHLENLDPDISHVDTGNANNSKLMITSARQTDDLDWSSFVGNTAGSGHQGGSVCTVSATSQPQSSNYMPVKNANVTKYEGLKYSVKEIETKGAGSRGMFEETPKSSVTDLKLIDFNVESTDGNAGALAGKSQGTVKNIVAYDSDKDKYEVNKVEGSTAGGLIGEMGSGTVQYCGAAVMVDGSTNAGGLIGTASTADSVVDASFSGGHTKDGDYRKIGPFDVTSNSGTAGGLIGNSAATVKNSYSTCSAGGGSSVTAGGLIGNATGGSVDNCYSTGQVGGSTDDTRNAFIGKGTPTISSRCWYYRIINYYSVNNGKSYNYKEPESRNNDNVVALESVNSNGVSEYDSFVKGLSTWNPAEPYDSFLSSRYKKSGEAAYTFRTATQLKAGTKSTSPSITSGGATEDLTKYFVNTHYGDWPAPEVLIVNQ